MAWQATWIVHPVNLHILNGPPGDSWKPSRTTHQCLSWTEGCGSFDRQPLVSVDWHKCERKRRLLDWSRSKKNRSNTGNVKWIKLERVDMARMPQNERAACDADIKATQYRWLVNTISTMDCHLHEVISSHDHLWGTPTLKHSPCNSCPQLLSLANNPSW